MSSAIVFDLEFTAWPGSMEEPLAEARRVQGSGADRGDQGRCEARSTRSRPFDALVRPRINPATVGLSRKADRASPMKRLAERGTDFVPAYERFVEFAAGAPIVAFGRDDLVLTSNLRLYGIADCNAAAALRQHRALAGGERRRSARAACLRYRSRRRAQKFEGRRHDALADARSVALGIKTLVARGAPNPLLVAVTQRGRQRSSHRLRSQAASRRRTLSRNVSRCRKARAGAFDRDLLPAQARGSLGTPSRRRRRSLALLCRRAARIVVSGYRRTLSAACARRRPREEATAADRRAGARLAMRAFARRLHARRLYRRAGIRIQEIRDRAGHAYFVSTKIGTRRRGEMNSLWNRRGGRAKLRARKRAKSGP